MSSPAIHWLFSDRVELLDTSAEVIIHSPQQRLVIPHPTPALDHSLRSLKPPGAPLASLREPVRRAPVTDRLQLEAYLQALTRQGLVCQTLLDSTAIATRQAISPYFQIQPYNTTAKYTLSRFAYCHSQAGTLWLESPRAHARVLLHDWRSMALLTSVNSQTAIAIPGVSEDLERLFAQFLAEIGILVPLTEVGITQEEDNEVLRQWEFHDLLFHSRSRRGRHAQPVGGTYRFRGEIDPLPVVKPAMSNQVIPLYQPDLEHLKLHDTPFTQVLERRRSLRLNPNPPITLQQLGEFLYRSARIQALVSSSNAHSPSPGDSGSRQTYPAGGSKRPYPGGGAIHELELYVLANSCKNLERGVYHYCPQHHHLEKLSVQDRYLDTLLNGARAGQGRENLPAILIVITARFQRISWKYAAIAYSLVLKHVGVLVQTMYLVASAMQIPCCAIGVGDSDLFAKATGLDYYVESAVGEFTLG